MTIRISFVDKVVHVAVAIDGKIESLITELPPRPWVGLTDEEYTELWGMKPDLLNFFRKIEAKLKEKNT